MVEGLDLEELGLNQGEDVVERLVAEDGGEPLLLQPDLVQLGGASEDLKVESLQVEV